MERSYFPANYNRAASDYVLVEVFYVGQYAAGSPVITPL